MEPDSSCLSGKHGMCASVSLAYVDEPAAARLGAKNVTWIALLSVTLL